MGKEAFWMGIVSIAFGIFLLVITRLNIVGVIYGIGFMILGLAIIGFNKEDKIEERKDLKSKKSGK
jgi:hypothetical protein